MQHAKQINNDQPFIFPVLNWMGKFTVIFSLAQISTINVFLALFFYHARITRQDYIPGMYSGYLQNARHLAVSFRA